MYSELRAEDFRGLYRLLGECQELWLDPQAWQAHLLAGISTRIHLPVGMHCAVTHFDAGQRPQIVSGCEHGWPDGAQQAHFRRGMRHGAGPFHTLFDRRFRESVTRHGDLTCARADLLTDTEWNGSELFDLVYRPAGMTELICSAVRTGSEGRFDLLGFGGAGHRPTARDSQFVALLHRELIPLIGTRLTTEADHSLHALSPRRRQILALALAGLPEKTIADHLALRPSTVNESLQRIYAHFAVHTRAQLMAYLAARRPVSRRNGQPAQPA